QQIAAPGTKGKRRSVVSEQQIAAPGTKGKRRSVVSEQQIAAPGTKGKRRSVVSEQQIAAPGTKGKRRSVVSEQQIAAPGTKGKGRCVVSGQQIAAPETNENRQSVVSEQQIAAPGTNQMGQPEDWQSDDDWWSGSARGRLAEGDAMVRVNGDNSAMDGGSEESESEEQATVSEGGSSADNETEVDQEVLPLTRPRRVCRPPKWFKDYVQDSDDED
ncbi:MAG: hypothetical protein ABW185_29920, partial [Sedimenticola sp.]